MRPGCLRSKRDAILQYVWDASVHYGLHLGHLFVPIHAGVHAERDAMRWKRGADMQCVRPVGQPIHVRDGQLFWRSLQRLELRAWRSWNDQLRSE